MFRGHDGRNAFVTSTSTGTNSMRPIHITTTIASRVVTGKLTYVP